MNPDTSLNVLHIVLIFGIPVVLAGMITIFRGRKNRHPGMDDQIFR